MSIGGTQFVEMVRQSPKQVTVFYDWKGCKPITLAFCQEGFPTVSFKFSDTLWSFGRFFENSQRPRKAASKFPLTLPRHFFANPGLSYNSFFCRLGRPFPGST
jgi:hypothetical protein